MPMSYPLAISYAEKKPHVKITLEMHVNMCYVNVQKKCYWRWHGYIDF